ncbi:MAG TPA: uracil-DNA glycosylase, partial [Gammaproteobacteria bacterium]|nr:uracil-DNA glycosylase [Gammaproteobacteria bacterium]
MAQTADNRRYLQAMGIDVWLPRAADPVALPEINAVNAIETTAPVSDDAKQSSHSNTISDLDWDALAARVAVCTACGLHQTRTQTVFGVGNRQADWMIIGEAPGAEEDRQGEPFVGRGGQLLDNMLRAVGLNRDTVFIANILKCRPPGNRDPKPEETAHCS